MYKIFHNEYKSSCYNSYAFCGTRKKKKRQKTDINYKFKFRAEN